MDKLKKCPFCGSTKLKIDKKSKLYENTAIARIENHTFSVRCNVCHARGGAVGGKVADFRYTKNPLPEYLTTDVELKQKAIEAWNNRKPVENVIKRLEEEKGIAFVTLANTGDSRYDLVYDNVMAYINKAVEIIKEEINKNVD